MLQAESKEVRRVQNPSGEGFVNEPPFIAAKDVRGDFKEGPSDAREVTGGQ